jgi:hypothetical protein
MVLPSLSPHKFERLIPDHEDFMYIKLDKQGKIICSIGSLIKKIFSLDIKKLNSKNIATLDIQFFKEFLYTIITQKDLDCSVYQFGFQFKDNIVPYVCSVYPCKISNIVKSFDITIRENNKEDTMRFFTNL